MILMNVDRRGRATLPDEVRRALGIGSDDTNLVILEKTASGGYEMIPDAVVPKDQLWFYHPEMQARIAQAEADFREGRFFSADTPEEAQALLDEFKKNLTPEETEALLETHRKKRS